MSLSFEDWKNLGAAVQSVATVVSFVIGGIWVYMRYIRQQEKYPNIEFSADVQLIGIQDGYWIAELIATVDNKGKAQHRMSEFRFDLNGIEQGTAVGTSPEWGNQVNFPVPIAQGSFLPERYNFFFIDPGVKAKYSYIARIPTSSSFVIFHCWFKYKDTRMVAHTAERTLAVPQESAAVIS
ncbi:MAG TPA: hypothetical protein PLC86_11390 [Candidatus Accumulibacter phosphatis]|nr:hypothetical protein [Candidatus Accumulibacter phosphatis]